MAEQVQPQNTAPTADNNVGDQANPQQQSAGIVEKTREYLQQQQSSGGQNVAGTGAATSSSPQQSQADSKQSVSVRGMTNIADALFAKGVIDEQQLRSIKFESITNNVSPVSLLKEKGLASDAQIQQIRAEMYGIGFIDLPNITIPSKILNRISKDIASKNMAIAFEETSNRVKVAMLDPLDLQKVKFLESILGKRVDTYYATAEAIKNVIDTKYGAQIGNVVDKALEDIGVIDINQDVGGSLDQGAIEGAPVSKIVNMILDYAVKHNASDVHIEPRDNRLAVRFRIHGILSEKLSLPSKLSNSIVARIKILANLKIDEHRVPQDGRFQVKADNRAIDLRVSVMPSIYGEKVVMRLLEKNKELIDINGLGLRGPGLKQFKQALNSTQGIILITGPTGSGKTVTLASSLQKLNSQEVNILTLEDPVEIRIDGITQVQVNSDVGLTFASGLRAFLRQDPDIIMVGEIRDAETAQLAVQAALTGHLVLATLHTNSAAGAVTRLLDIGVAPYLISSTVNVVVGQRLVRKLCQDVKQPYHPTDKVVEMMHKNLDRLSGFDLVTADGSNKIHFDAETNDIQLYKPGKGPNCEDGFAGRIGIFEVMAMSDQISKMVMENPSSSEIHEQAVKEGMITMAQDGFMKALEGVTTIEEVLRVQTD